MRIGIDLSILQGDNRITDNAQLLLDFLNNLPDIIKQKYTFVFFLDKNTEKEVLDYIHTSGLKYEISHLNIRAPRHYKRPLRLFIKIYTSLIGFIQYYTGDPRVNRDQLSGLGCFIQFDKYMKNPGWACKNSILVINDLFELSPVNEQLPTYRMARAGCSSITSSIKSALRRQKYLKKIKINVKRSNLILVTSNKIRDELINFSRIRNNKVIVIKPGTPFSTKEPKKHLVEEHITTMWGAVRSPVDLSTKPFLLYVGETGEKAQLTRLVAAYYNLRARAVNISLVLSGHALINKNDLKDSSLEEYLQNNQSYQNDIHLVGPVSADTLKYLYHNALAFVSPAKYDGSSMHVIPALGTNTFAIVSSYTSAGEIKSDNIIYAEDTNGIVDAVQTILKGSKRPENDNDIPTWMEVSAQLIDTICNRHK